jgi:hypothetical protein
MGIVGVAIGVPLIAIDGKGIDCEVPDRIDKCKNIVSTAAGGWVLTSMGIAALGASGVLFYLHFTSKPKEQTTANVGLLTVNPIPNGGVVLSASGRF